ncbi:hypothetical protein [Mesorhizobium argentiipisi]|uniref:Uncharacterized protein n=1 Tax=Mesorhizobium argentiipisi TaxID=3015175 RepID=A0ABU8KMJ2_9HYPH
MIGPLLRRADNCWRRNPRLATLGGAQVEGQHGARRIRPAEAGQGNAVLMCRNSGEDMIDGPGPIRFNAAAILTICEVAS